MTKDQLILLLRKYKENKSKLRLKLREKERKLRDLEKIQEAEIKSGENDINSGIRSKNSISDKVGNFASNTADKEKELKLEIESLQKEIDEISANLEEVDIRLDALKNKEKQILIDYYIEGNTYEQIANKLNKTHRNIQEIVKNAIEKIANI